MSDYDAQLEAALDAEGDRFARNAQLLDAVIVAGGDSPRYAWKVSQQGPWVTATPAQIRSLEMKGAGRDTWLEWPNGNEAVIMPDWWTPEHQTTYRDKRDGSHVPAKWVAEGCTPFDALAHYYERVTVDLATGEETVMHD